jgi:hypothetical protein
MRPLLLAGLLSLIGCAALAQTYAVATVYSVPPSASGGADGGLALNALTQAALSDLQAGAVPAAMRPPGRTNFEEPIQRIDCLTINGRNAAISDDNLPVPRYMCHCDGCAFENPPLTITQLSSTSGRTAINSVSSSSRLWFDSALPGDEHSPIWLPCIRRDSLMKTCV